jgi:hypothetical protein
MEGGVSMQNYKIYLGYQAEFGNQRQNQIQITRRFITLESCTAHSEYRHNKILFWLYPPAL